MSERDNINIGIIVNKNNSKKAKRLKVRDSSSKEVVYVNLKKHKDFVNTLFSMGMLARNEVVVEEGNKELELS